MDKQTNFTCRVDADLKQAFLRAAKAHDRPASVLIRDFMRHYVQMSSQGEQVSFPFDLEGKSDVSSQRY